jgi:LacI family transcriptional regulator
MASRTLLPRRGETGVTTILDVARHAGVSTKTVSRVLNREAHVRDAVRTKVEASVAALGYRPNLAARQLAGQRSYIIAYPFNNPSPAYITDVLMGAARACRDRGYHLVSEPMEIDDQLLPLLERLIVTLRPDGMILTPPLCDMPAVVAHVARFTVPLVRIAGGKELYGASIALDERAISTAMAAHLVALGHRRIGFIEPHPDHALAQARTHGYLDGLAAAGIVRKEALIRPGRFDVESGAQAARVLLGLAQPPSAIFAANDDMALGAMQVAHERGMSIPRDIALAGFDDSAAGRLVYPPLTTVRQPMQMLGATAAAMLLGDAPDAAAIRHELLVRGSTGSG